MYPNNGYYGQPYGQPYPSGNPYTMGTTQYSSPQSQMQYPPFNPTNVQQHSYQPQQAAQISGRVVQNENEITPQEVPMDGTVSLFPTADYKCIYAKVWNSDGTIRTLKFSPVGDSEESNPTPSFRDEVMARFDAIEERLDKKQPQEGYSNQTLRARHLPKEESNEL